MSINILWWDAKPYTMSHYYNFFDPGTQFPENEMDSHWTHGKLEAVAETALALHNHFIPSVLVNFNVFLMSMESASLHTETSLCSQS